MYCGFLNNTIKQKIKDIKMDNQNNNPRADLRNAIYNYFLAKIAEDESFMPDSIHRDIVSVADDVAISFEDKIDDGVIDLSL